MVDVGGCVRLQNRRQRDAAQGAVHGRLVFALPGRSKNLHASGRPCALLTADRATRRSESLRGLLVITRLQMAAYAGRSPALFVAIRRRLVPNLGAARRSEPPVVIEGGLYPAGGKTLGHGALSPSAAV
jgi:hypothetical protein